ncbi:MAG TPA: exopolysaccharide biosynthesis polyprenyl glycosylphosphotransferase [Geomonas sp.]|nr:exopolysaccharide biosynthesis polyprenyl glycosylphosphotransferase [Geomonas sp.]
MEANKKNFLELHQNRHARIDSGIVDHEYRIHIEEYFQELLCLERKRSERSRKPFVLMRVSFDGDFPGHQAFTIRKIVEVLATATRETDVMGWISRERMIGVIFTDISEEQVDLAREHIDHKVRGSLASHLPDAVVDRLTITYQVYPEKYDQTGRGEPFNMLFYPDVLEQNSSHRAGDFLKRLMDIVGSLFGLLVFSPLFLVIALAVRITSPGPVLFRQERYGQYGKRFVFLKFRSMKVDNDDAIHRAFVSKLIRAGGDGGGEQDGECGEKVYKITKDPRVTPLGQFLRKTSLDELPQFVNVLKGEMSLVGPRPPIPYELESYDAWHRHRLLGTKPGITGLWQVKGRSSTSFDSMVRLDLQYIREWSIWLDIKLLLQTPLAVLKGKGAY